MGDFIFPHPTFQLVPLLLHCLWLEFSSPLFKAPGFSVKGSIPGVRWHLPSWVDLINSRPVSSMKCQKATVASAQTYYPASDFYVSGIKRFLPPFFSHAYRFYNKRLGGDGSILPIIFIVLEGRHTICIPTCSWNPPTSYLDCGCIQSPQYIKGLSIF